MTTKPLHRSLLFIVLSLLFVNSCKKDVDEFIVEESMIIGSTTWIGDVEGLTAAIPAPQIAYTLENTENISFTTTSFSNFTLTEDALVDEEGETITGAFDVNILEVISKGNMIRNQISAIANGELLHLSAAFALDFKQGTETLQLNPEIGMNITFPTANFNNQSKLFYGFGENVLWEDATLSGGMINSTEIYDEELEEWLPAYFTNSSKLSWVAVANFLTEEPIDGYKISIDLPTGLNAENTLAFVVFDAYNTVIELKPNAEGGFFVENIPADEMVLLLTLSERKEGELLISQKIFLTQSNDVNIGVTPVQVISANELELFLDAL